MALLYTILLKITTKCGLNTSNSPKINGFDVKLITFQVNLA